MLNKTNIIYVMRPTNLRFHLGAKGPRAIDFCPAHLDILLTKRISHDMNVVTHIHDGVRHFPDTRSRAMIGWKRTGRHHRDRVAAFSWALSKSAGTHETPDVAAGTALAGLESVDV